MLYIDVETFRRELEQHTNDRNAYIIHGTFKDVPKFFEEWSSIRTPKHKDVYYQFIVNGTKESLFEIWEDGSYLKESGYNFEATNKHISGDLSHESVMRSGLQMVDLKNSTRISFSGSANEIMSKGTGKSPVILKLNRDKLYLFHSYSFDDENTISFRAEFFEK